MSFTFKTRGIGDLVKHEIEPQVGYAREEITVGSTPAVTLPMGSVVFRAVANTPGNYAVLSNVSQFVATNEFAIVLGDTLGEVLSLSVPAAGTANCAAIVRGQVVLSDKYVFDTVVANGLALDTTARTNLTHMLKKQGIILEITI
jgi:hypothetical protein